MRRRRATAVVAWSLLAGACAGSDTIDGLTAAPPEAGHPAGVIAVGSPLQLLDADGVEQGDVGDRADAVTQPTWSRDGSRLVMAILDDDGHRTEVIDGSSGRQLHTAPAPRPHFFFSWSHDGTHIAALGPGPRGTTLDLLDREGTIVQEAVLGSGSIFLAWEPGGDRIVANAGGELLVLEPGGADGWEARSLGPLGTPTLTPKWIPGSGEVLVVEARAEGPRLVRRRVEPGDGEAGVGDDLGPVPGATSITVHPEGGRAVVARSAAPTTPGEDAIIPAAFVQDERPDALVEVVDLRDGSRTPILNDVVWWAEWSPDGRRLLLATLADDGRSGRWLVWHEDTAGIEQEAPFVPTPDFFLDYLRFADQYVEQPRLWAPDSTAFVTPSQRVDGPRILVVEARAGGDVAEIAEGAVAFWSPVAPTP